MQAIVKPDRAPGAELRQVGVPEIGARDVLIRVRAASICGTDLHIYAWDRWAQRRLFRASLEPRPSRRGNVP
jgi:threonine 3-dehydrogenase